MLALALAATISLIDLQQWIDDQPAVVAYEQQRAARSLPADDAFSSPPVLPVAIACRRSQSAMTAAVSLFKAADGGKITLTEPLLLTRTAASPSCS